MGTVKYTGPVASFHCPTEATIRSLKVHFSPKQNLNGQTKPWPAGGGKNILNMDWFIATNSYISSTGATGTMAYYSYTDYLELAPNTYTISGINNTVNSNLRIHSYNENKEWVKQLTSKYLAQGATFSCTFTVTSDDKYIRISAPAKTPENPYLQLEVGSTATAYVPYENICPIEGWDGVVVHNDDGIVVPEEYQKVEYLESDGHQYLDTQIIPSNNLIIDSTIELASDRGIGNEGILGSRQSSGGGRVYLISFYQNAWHYGIDGDNMINSPYSVTRYIPINVHAEYVTNKILLKVGELTLYSGSTNYSGNDYSLYVFACNNFGTAARYCAARVYNLSIQKNNSLVLHYVPCRRKSDNKPGMYDTVSGQFFTNQGTGEFICGPDVGQTTSYDFGALGKNKYNYQLCNIIDLKAKNDEGVEIDASANKYDSTYTPVLPATTYIISGLTGTGSQSYNDGYKRVYFYTRTKQWIARSDPSITSQLSFTTPNNCYYIQIQGAKNETYENIQLEYGSTATTYEPCKSTVYGGWVDLISGVVCEEWHKMVIDTTSRIGIFPWGGIKTDTITGTEYATALFRRESTDPRAYTIKDNLCDKLPISTNLNTINTAYVYDGDTYGPAVSLPTSVIGTTNETLTEYLTDNPFTFVYKQRVPNTYHLSPIALQTFLGQNNVWSNADYVEVEYDLHETQTILARKQFIVANQPHIVKPAAAPLQNFVTDVPAPLRECRVYFSPVQEGSGDASLENVRPINGFEEIKLLQCKENLWNKETATPQYINSGSSLSASDANNLVSDWIEVIPNKTYIYSYQPIIGANITGSYTSLWTGAGFYKTQSVSDTATIRKTWLAPSSTDIQQIKITIPENCHYIRIGSRHLNIDGAWARFEPYEESQITSTSINWSGSLGTIYGGYVDLVKGELVEEWHKIVADGVNVTCTPNYRYQSGDWFGGAIVYLNPYGMYDSYASPRLYCDILPKNVPQSTTPFIGTTFAGYQYVVFYLFNLNDYGGILPEKTEVVTMTNTWLQEHPVTIVYKLFEPIHYSLTPQTLRTLRGTNNIWSTANGNIELSYWTH